MVGGSHSDWNATPLAWCQWEDWLVMAASRHREMRETERENRCIRKGERWQQVSRLLVVGVGQEHPPPLRQEPALHQTKRSQSPVPKRQEQDGSSQCKAVLPSSLLCHPHPASARRLFPCLLLMFAKVPVLLALQPSTFGRGRTIGGDGMYAGSQPATQRNAPQYLQSFGYTRTGQKPGRKRNRSRSKYLSRACPERDPDLFRSSQSPLQTLLRQELP